MHDALRDTYRALLTVLVSRLGGPVLITWDEIERAAEDAHRLHVMDGETGVRLVTDMT